MKPEYHRHITIQALDGHVSTKALRTIISANLHQDALRYQFGHDHYHYDNNSFAEGDAYIEEQRRVTLEALARSSASLAWQAFGRLLHAAQDFYAHTNYVTLWRADHPTLTSDEILPLNSAADWPAPLHSGRLYYPLEALSFVPFIGKAVALLLPHDSHAWMNKDDPSRPNFDLAYAAAVKRSGIEFQHVLGSLEPLQQALFTGKA